MEAREQYSEAMEKGSPLPSAFASPQKAKVASTPPPSPILSVSQIDLEPRKGTVNVSKSLLKAFDATENRATEESEKDNKALDNEKLVNDMLHEPHLNVLEAMHITNKDTSKFGEIQVTFLPLFIRFPGSNVDFVAFLHSNSLILFFLQAQIKKTMEDAFWDGVLEGLEREPPDNKRIINLLEEMKSELENLVPETWKEELHECMDVDIFSQVMHFLRCFDEHFS